MQLFICIKDKQDKISITEGSLGTFYTDFLNYIHRFPNTGGIQQLQRDIVDRYIFFYYITRCSRYIGHNRFVVTGKRIKQGGLADIRAADNSRRNAFAQNFSLIGRLQQLINTLHYLTAFLFNELSRKFFYIMFRIINIHFNVCQCLNKGMAQNLYPFG
ncbi:hypothetical protein D3C81_1396530 [compost metagenome]